MEGKIVITVIGADKTGIVAAVSSKLNEMNINIIDISQTIFENNIFTMMMLTEAKELTNMKDIQDELKKLEQSAGVKIFAQHEDIFKSMHRI